MTTQNFTKVPSQETIKQWLTQQIAQQFQKNIETIDPEQPFTEYGLDSIIAFTIVGDLEEWLEEESLELEIPPTLMWDYRNINRVSEYIVSRLEEEVAA
ncbi:MAG: acyl carrier protein [Microcystaceae cyanobacterium]